MFRISTERGKVNSYILFGLLFLVACTPTNGTLCFKTENAGWSDFFYSNRTDHKVNEDMKLLITICEKSASNDSKIVPFPVKEIKQSNEKPSDCFFDGKSLNVGCPKNKYCEVTVFEGVPLPLCNPR